ncbi:MAG: hypothetical protein IPL65_16000 [Lewinellaceae bacterium]|nr:hypothetical protein [Lewinellaceae bacterium]
MQKSVLVEIARSLSKKEQRELNKWLRSPSHNQREDVVNLFDYLLSALSKNDEALKKQKVWPAVYPGEPYDDARMRQVMYFLGKAVEEYLAFEDYKNNQFQYQLALSRQYRQRKLEKAYRQAKRLSTDALENQPLRNADYLLQKFFLETEDYEYQLGLSQSTPVNLQEVANALEKWFTAEKLRTSLEMLAHRTVFQKAQYTDGLLPETLHYVERGELIEDPAISVYYYIYMAVTNPDKEEYFEQFENLIHSEQALKFDRDEVRNLYLAAWNYCVPKISAGRQDFARRAFELYRQGVDTGILLENEKLSRYTFINIVGIALRVREYEWVESFVNNYQQYLEEKYRKSIVHFNLSRIYFEKGDYDQAQRMLLNFEYDEMHLNIIAKTMLLKIYYEQTELDAFESLLESMRIYLQRKEALDTARKSAYKNMISLMKKLLNHNPYSKAQTERLREIFSNTQPLMERDWLLRQLD